MATLLLAAAGTAIGGAIGGTFLGLTAAAVGGAIGTAIGSYIDSTLFIKGQHVEREGPRLNELQVQGSTEGIAVYELWGTMRVAGQVIWAQNFKEVVTTETEEVGGKGGGPSNSVTTTTYAYYISLAIAVCREVTSWGRVWADQKIFDLSGVNYRQYNGNHTLGDAVIQATQGIPNTPFYKDCAYIVFEELPLENFGNRIPNLVFELTNEP